MILQWAYILSFISLTVGQCSSDLTHLPPDALKAGASGGQGARLVRRPSFSSTHANAQSLSRESDCALALTRLSERHIPKIICEP
jgi:hypothetical protein